VTTGQELRDEGIEQASLASLWDDWPKKADRWIEFMAQTGQEFTAEDLRSACGDPSRPAQVGARLLAAARRGLIERVGFAQASRSERHGGWVGVWRGTWQLSGTSSGDGDSGTGETT
jgi:hypothetical protein